MRVQTGSDRTGYDGWYPVIIARQNISQKEWNEYYDSIVAWCDLNISHDYAINPNDPYYHFNDDFIRYAHIGSCIAFQDKEDAAKYLLWFGNGVYNHF
jgi:hypothetical protein